MAKTKLGLFLQKIGNFFTGLFDAAEKAWDNVSPEVQKALEQGSAIIAVINENIDEAPDFIFDLIQQRFPDLTKEKIVEALNVAAKEANLTREAVDGDDIVDVIRDLQIYLSDKEGAFWASASSFLACVLAIVFAPKETKFSTISSLITWVYQAIVKKR